MRPIVVRTVTALVGALLLWTVWLFSANPFGYCTLMGCESYLTIDTGVVVIEYTTYRVQACLDGECWEGTTVANDSRDDDSGIQLESGGSISLYLAGEDRSTTSTISVVIWADGEEILRHQGEVVFEVHRPNGRWCEPTCYFGHVVI